MAKAFDPWPAGPHAALPHARRTAGRAKALSSTTCAPGIAAYGTGNGQIAIVGDFDPEQVKPLLRKLFADWKPGVAYAPIPRSTTR